MTRQELDERLVDYLFDELSAEEATRFEDAVTGHPDLEAEVAAHRRTREEVAELPQREMAPHVMAAVMREARAAVVPEAPAPGWFEKLLSALMQPAMVTAMLVFVVGGTSVFVVSQQSTSEDASTALMAESSAEPLRMAKVARSDRSAPADAKRAAEPAGGTVKVAAVDLGGRGSLPEAAGGAPAGTKDEAGDEREYKPLTQSVARLVEVDLDEQGRRKKGKRSSARKKAKPRERSRRAKPMQVAAAPTAKRKEMAANEPSAKVAYKSVAQARIPETGNKRLARNANPSIGASYDFADDMPEAADAEAEAPARGQPQVSSTRLARQSRAEKAPALSNDAKQGKSLVTEFERSLKKGDASGAAKALDRLAKVPGFAKTAKRKRAELRKWMKQRAEAKSKKASKKAKGKKAAPSKRSK